MLPQIITKKYSGNTQIFGLGIRAWLKGSKINQAGEYRKKLIKIKFNLDNNLPLNKTLKLYNLTIIIRFVFQVCMSYQDAIKYEKIQHQKSSVFFF